MPYICSAPGCRSNCNPLIKYLFQDAREARWTKTCLVSLHIDDIEELKVVYVCSKHLRVDEVETTHKVPNGDGSYREILRRRPKLKDGAVPTILPGCPAYYSSHLSTKRTRLSIDDTNFSIKQFHWVYRQKSKKMKSSGYKISMIYKLSWTFFQLLIYGPLGNPMNIRLFFCVLESIVLKFKLILAYQ